MRFSVMIWPYSGVGIEPVVRLAQCAERCGFETVYVGDSQMLWNDVYVCLACCAQATSRVRLAPGVTNLVTRHVTVTANAMLSLNMLSRGRAVLGVGAGDSAVRTAGLSPAKRDRLRRDVVMLRRLLSGEAVEPPRPSAPENKTVWGQVATLQLAGAEEWGKIPVEIAVMSPKAAGLVGEIGDGLIVDGHMGGNAEGARAAFGRPVTVPARRVVTRLASATSRPLTRRLTTTGPRLWIRSVPPRRATSPTSCGCPTRSGSNTPKSSRRSPKVTASPSISI